MKRFSLLLLVLGACVDMKDPISGTQSFNVVLKSPFPGTEAMRLPDTQRTVVIDVTALDAEGQLDTTYNNQVQVYVNFLGTLTPYLGGMPVLKSFPMSSGAASNITVDLPQVYGPATLFLDDGTVGKPNANPSYAVGASPTLWYRDPFIADIQTPALGNEAAIDALEKSPLEAKQVSVLESRNGPNGRLVITSVFAQGYTVSDVLCAANGAPPCTVTPNPKLTPAAPGYDHKMVFSFSAARDEHGCLIREGQVIRGFAGGVSEFNGLTEIGFPQSFVDRATEDVCREDEADINPARLPAPATFDVQWFTDKFMFERNEAAPIAVLGAKVCNLDVDYDTYKQWKIDPTGVGGDCKGRKNVLNVISNGVVPAEMITPLPGRTVPKVVGVLRPVNIGTFNVWILYPRSMADLTLQ